jgi:KipI family sensor histidine kinase inhibitor
VTESGRRLLPNGDAAVLVDLDALDDVLRLYPALQASRPPGVIDVVPGARSILVTCDPDVLPLRALRAWAAGTRPVAAGAAATGEVVEVDVRYDGADLDEVARLTGLTSGEVVAAHVGTPWTVAFGGFAPGFSYLVGGDPRLQVPRRDSPRTRVPAGAVGLAGEFSGVYPRESPGGWQLIGRTATVMWDSTRPAPALLTPGMTVRFVVAR